MYTSTTSKQRGDEKVASIRVTLEVGMVSRGVLIPDSIEYR